MSTVPTSLPGCAPTGLVPLVIGVTGHRDLDPGDYPAYRLRIAALFAQLRRLYPSTPLRIISALAEGADRLAAEVALECGCELLVPLPLERHDYELDFPNSVEEFKTLLDRVPAEQVFVLPQLPGEAPHDCGTVRRDRQYREVGAYIAAQSHVLLALWDGLPNESIAGTAAVVRLKLEGALPNDSRQLSALDSEDGGPVVHILARRAGSGPRPDVPPKWIFPNDTEEKLFRTLCGRIDRFNADAARLRGAAAAASLIPDLGTRPANDRNLAAVFVTADRLAHRYQRLTHSALRLLVGLAAALALTFELYAEILPRRALPSIYLLIFTLIVLLYLWQKRLDAHGRYLDYRALAEGIRVQFYWRLAGLTDSAAANYLRKQLDELRWIREALRGAGAIPAPTQPRLDLVFGSWVHHQAQYYRGRARLQERRAHRIEQLSLLCLALGLVTTAGLVGFWNSLERMGLWHHWLVLVMGFAPIVAALWETYGERFGLRTQAHQYARFAAIFGRAEQAIVRLQTESADVQRNKRELALIRELGREALMESGDWVLLLRDRPVVLPKG